MLFLAEHSLLSKEQCIKLVRYKTLSLKGIINQMLKIIGAK